MIACNEKGICILLATLGFFGCDLVDETTEEPLSCTQDFDCNPGEVCSEQGACTVTAKNGKRVFGSQELASESIDDQFLVSVHSLPVGTQSPSGDPYIFFTLEGAASSSIAKKITKQVQKVETNPKWKNRFAMDKARHQAINDMIEGIKSGHRVIRDGQHKSASCADCDSLTMCWKGQCTSDVVAKLPNNTEFSGTLATVIENEAATLNVVLENSMSDDAKNKAKDAANLFAASLAGQLPYFGKQAHEGELDCDEDGRLNLFFTTNQIQEGVVGFFVAEDFFPASDASATGNASDILWVQAPNETNSTMSTVGTLVHEYVHLAAYGIRVYGSQEPAREDLWLDEALAHTMEDLMGWGPSNVDTAQAALTSWSTTGFAARRDSTEMRGMGYTLIRYLLDRKAAAAGATKATDPSVVKIAQEVISELMLEKEKGFAHSFFQSQSATDYSQWLLALYADGNEDLPQTIVPGYLSVDEAPTGNLQGFGPWATLRDTDGNDIEFEGLEPEELDGPPEEEEGEIFVGGSALYLITGLEPGTHTIKGVGDAFVGEEAADLYLSVTKLQ